MTKLPEKDLLSGSKTPRTTTGEMKSALGRLRDFLSELFGDDSSDKETARQTLGIDLSTLANRMEMETALSDKVDKSELALLESDIAKRGTPVGSIDYFAMATPPASYLKADGSQVGRETYPDLFAAIGTTFGSGDGSTTFNLPDLIDRFAEGSSTPGVKREAGLPNIAGVVGPIDDYSSSNLTGSFYNAGAIGYDATSGNTGNGWKLGFDASRSNPIYGASETVQPPSLTLLPCIKAFDAYPAVQAGISAMNAIGAPTRAARATVEPHASKAWVNFDASSGEITIRNAHHVDKVIRVEKGAFDIIFDGSVQADCCTVTVSSSALVSAVNLDSFTGDYFPPSANRVRVVTASGFPIQPVDPADINVVVNQ